MLNKRGRILLIGSVLWACGEGMLGPLFAVFTQRIGGSILDITSAWAIFLAVTGISIILVGKVTDSLRNSHARERIMVAGYALNALCTFGYLLVTTPTHLLLVQAGLGFAVALSSPTWLSLYSDNNKKNAGALSWGLESGLSYIMHAISILIGGYIVSTYSFNVLFVMMGVIQVIATIYQAQILRIKGK